MATALYPGAFKPPHRGHFEVVKKLLDGTHNGKLYTKDTSDRDATSALAGKTDKIDPIDKVVIFIGAKERNGISTDISVAIWEVYKKYLGNVELYYEVSNPMQNASSYAKKRPDEKFYAITGIRSEEDMIDLKRISSFKNRENVEGLIISAPGGTRATDFRQAILSGNLDSVRDFFPKELKREEILGIIRMLKDSIIAERMQKALEETMQNLFEEEKVEERTTALSLKPTKSADRAQLLTLFNRIRNQIETPGVKVVFKDDHIEVGLEDYRQDQFDFKPYMASLLEHMIDEGMKIVPLPEITIKRDVNEAGNFFGKTAYYDPNVKEVVLYVEGRHPKDIMRSFSHEMIHHMQNLENRLGSIGTSNTNEDDNLLKIEQEAYLKGNITFRNWEDKIKNQDKEVMAEGKYDKLTNVLSKIAFEFFKDVHDRGDKKGEFTFKVGNPDHDNVDIESREFEFDFMGIVKYTKDEYKVDGGANAGYDDDGDEIQPMLNVAFKIPKNPDWQEVSMDIKDVVRHELEHLTQDGENVRSGKYLPDDKDLRDLMDAGMLDKDLYFTLDKEVDAMIQGLYYKAKKSKKPFADVVDDYLNKAMISLDNKEKVLTLWRKRLPALGIKQRL